MLRCTLMELPSCLRGGQEAAGEVTSWRALGVTASVCTSVVAQVKHTHTHTQAQAQTELGHAKVYEIGKLCLYT